MKNNRRRNRKRFGFQGITLSVSTALVLILLGLVILTGFTANNLSKQVKENFTITLILSNDMSQVEAQQFCTRLKGKTYVSSMKYITKEQVLAEGTKALGANPKELVGYNFYSPLVELQLKSDYANSESLKWISAELHKDKNVSDIEFPKDLIDSVNKTLQLVIVILLVLAGLLTFISFSLINNTVRLSVYSRRFNIHTMKLVGASWGFIRRPFMRQVVRYGLIAGVLAVIVLGTGLYLLSLQEPNMLTVITPEAMIITGISVIVLGIVITAICVWLSVNKFLRMRAGDLYKI
ncbi:MAG: permease-like cell division protein FtsX [Prevotellaceae bacterium]|nr:permease-like cell division protein FtsX [Prevotella sp.]MDD7531045.1 permease-like cell division protein FtsX [Prevotellaceae bacterium]MDY2634176.1 permease-like cell division protein FtsX [Prevotella sp.]